MHYYKHHLGDYETRTRHLSLAEHGAYRQLMDAYYATEEPLPLDINRICKMVRVSNRTEKRHVLAIIVQFFEQSPDGFRHKRIDREIAVYREKALINKGNAKRTAKRNESQPHSETVAKPVTSNQEPRTNIHIPPNPQGGKAKPKPSINLEGFEPFWKVYPKQRLGSRQNAEKAYSKALARGHPPWAILEGAKAYAVSREVADGFAKGTAAWLNDDRFLNDHGEDKNGKRGHTNGSMATAALAKIAREAEIAESGENWGADIGGYCDAGGPSEKFDGVIDALPCAIEGADTGRNIQNANTKPGRNGLGGGNGYVDG